MWSIVTKTSDSSVLVDTANDGVDAVCDQEDDECGFERDLLQQSFHDAHSDEACEWVCRRETLVNRLSVRFGMV
jgi:hypothetical protein